MTWANTYRYIVEDKTADYTVTGADWGKLFTNSGAAGAITFTLPSAASTPVGVAVYFAVVTGQNVTIAGTAGQLVTFNDAAANSVAFSTALELIGAFVEAICISSSKWLIRVSTEESQTMTVAT